MSAEYVPCVQRVHAALPVTLFHDPAAHVSHCPPPVGSV